MKMSSPQQSGPNQDENGSPSASSTNTTNAKSESKSKQRHKENCKDKVYRCMITDTLAKAETRSVSVLRMAVISTLLITGILVSVGVYLYTKNEEESNFHTTFEDSAFQVLGSFHGMVERNLGAVAALSSAYTSYALQANLSFPFVTLPDFETMGSHFRAHGGSHIIHYFPLVTDEQRPEWEAFALQNRQQIDAAFEKDVAFRAIQDAALEASPVHPIHRQRRSRGRALSQQVQQDTELANSDAEWVLLEDAPLARRLLQQQESPPDNEKEPEFNLTVFGDGSNYHPRIWSNGALAPEGDEPNETGPYLPGWQRSPVDASKQFLLNLNWANAKVIGHGLLKLMINEKKAAFRGAAVPIPKFKKALENNLRVSQYRHHIEEYIDGLSTFMTYPVFDSFDSDKEVAGVLATNVYWKILLSNLLPSSSHGIHCVVENSFNQTFTYQIDGPEAFFLGMGDLHDSRFDHLEYSENVNSHLQQRASPRNRAYTTVQVSDTTQYTIRVYPSKATESAFLSNDPIIYTVVVILGFAFASILFLAFSYVVERRQHVMIAKVVENADRVNAAERELNEFLAHEVRNPLAAALSASSFVTAALHEKHNQLNDPETLKFMRDDMDVVNTSLNFINDFLRSMLDIHSADGNKIKIQKAPLDLLHDILEPVSAILHKRVANFEVIVDCPASLMVSMDSLRLKQVVLNLVRNSTKFVEQGFVRMRASVEEHQVRVYIEDSGPGVPEEKRKELFTKFQSSLDLLSQGTGLGLNLSKKLMQSMGGDIWLDESYDSGIPGCPGARFVIDLNTEPCEIDSTVLTESDTINNNMITNYAKVLDQPYRVPEPFDAESNGKIDGVEVKEEANGILGSSKAPLFSIPLPPAPTPSIKTETPATPATPATQTTSANPTTAAIPTTHQFTLPESSAQSSDLVELPKDLSILMVDDDAVLRKLFVRAMKRVEPSWKLQEASSGEQALRLCETQTYDIIFLDQYMASVGKQMLGTETAHAMRSRGIKSIICGLSANDIHEQFAREGASDFILKPLPCKPDVLKERLLKILESNNA